MTLRLERISSFVISIREGLRPRFPLQLGRDSDMPASTTTLSMACPEMEMLVSTISRCNARLMIAEMRVFCPAALGKARCMRLSLMISYIQVASAGDLESARDVLFSHQQTVIHMALL